MTSISASDCPLLQAYAMKPSSSILERRSFEMTNKILRKRTMFFVVINIRPVIAKLADLGKIVRDSTCTCCLLYKKRGTGVKGEQCQSYFGRWWGDLTRIGFLCATVDSGLEKHESRANTLTELDGVWSTERALQDLRVIQQMVKR